MLGLKLATDPNWINLAEKSIEEILVDHAYCEQKAASTCISMITLYAEHDDIVDALTPIVAEEWGHFQMVLRQLKNRGFSLGRKRNDTYVQQLYKKCIHKGGSRIDQLVEKLLICGLIEARSCERFKLLSEGISDDSLKEFYRNLMVSEAGHYRLFLDLARNYWTAEKVKTRFDELLELEAEVILNADIRGDRIH